MMMLRLVWFFLESLNRLTPPATAAHHLLNGEAKADDWAALRCLDFIEDADPSRWCRDRDAIEAGRWYAERCFELPAKAKR